MHHTLQAGHWPEPFIAPVSAANEPSFTIGDLAREFGVTFRALRFYESRGLLTPRRNGQMRLYGQGDRERLAQILRGKKLGFTLDEIHSMIGAAGGSPRAGLNLSRDTCVNQINLLERKKRQIETALAELRLAYAMSPALRHPD
jgi:DNA-binding transcriptional MerR regulator